MAPADPAPVAGLPLPTVEQVIRHRLATALGGWRGAVESSIPVVAFVLAWTLTQDVRTGVLWSAALTAALVVVALVQKQNLQFIGSAVFATAIAAFFALRSGRAEDAFLPGILAGISWGTGTLVSILARWPVIGFMVGAGDPGRAEDPFAWRRDPGMLAVCSRLTWVLVAMYALRVAIMLPLYLAHQVALLGVAKIVLGWPLWLGAVSLMGMVLVRGRTPQQRPSADSMIVVADAPRQN